MWARRLLIGSGFAVASLIAVPSAAGAASCGSMSGVSCSGKPPAIAGNSGTVEADESAARHAGYGGPQAPTTAPTTSLPFTGADVEELAVVGVGAVLAGSLLMRRRRRPVVS